MLAPHKLPETDPIRPLDSLLDLTLVVSCVVDYRTTTFIAASPKHTHSIGNLVALHWSAGSYDRLSGQLCYVYLGCSYIGVIEQTWGTEKTTTGNVLR